MKKVTLTLRNEEGLHARPAARFVEVAGEFQADITVQNLSVGGDPQNAKSILGVMAAGGESGHEIEVAAEGADEAEVVERLRRLVEEEFDGDRG